jgi:amino acid transporter
MFSATMPRAGGEYVYISRGLNSVIGFICNFGMAMTYLYYVGVYIVFALNPVLSNTIQALGVTMNNAGLIALSYETTSHAWVSITYVLLMVLFGILTIVLRPRRYGNMLLIMFIISLIGVPVLYGLIASTPQDVFIARMNDYASKLGASPDYYNYIINTANLESFLGPYPTVTLSGILGGIPTFYWGYQYSVFFSAYVSGEAKNPKRTQLLGMTAALILPLILAIISAVLVYTNIGAHFFYSFSFAYFDMPDKLQIYPAFPSLVLLAQVISNNAAIVAVLGFTFFIAQLMLVPTVFLGISRCIFAWSFDRVIPTALADIHKKFSTPWKAIAIAAVIAAFFGVWLTFGPIFFTVFWTAFINIIVWIIFGVTCIVFPYWHRDIFNASPVAYKVAGMPALSLCGLGIIVPQLLFAYELIADPGWSWAGAYAWQTYVLTFGIFIIGAVIYLAMWAYRKSKGTELGLAFKEIPPE